MFLNKVVIFATGKILPQVVNFLLLPIYTIYLSPTDYGIIEAMLVIGAILTIFYSLATERALFRVYYDYKTEEDKKKFIGNVSFLIFVSANIFLVLIFYFKNLFSKIYLEIPFNPYYIYIIITTYITTFSYIPQTLYQVQEKAKKFMAISLAVFFIEIIFIFYFIVLKNQGAIGFLKGKLMAAIFMLPVNLTIINKNSLFKLDLKIIKNIIAFSLPMFPVLLISWVMNMSNRIFIENFFSLKEVGLFSMAFRISSIVTILLGAIYTTYNPIFYRLANENNKSKIQKINTVLLFIIFFIALTVGFFVKDIFLLLNNNYQESQYYVSYLIFSIAINYITSIFTLMIYQNKRSLIIVFINFFIALLGIIFNFLLVPKYGSFGACWANIITSSIMLLITIIVAKKNYYIPFRFDLLTYLIVLLSFLFFISNLLEFSWLLLLAKLIIIICFGCFINKCIKRLSCEK